jgi:UDP:flavonoid glycosyltransferase YjiC (YdhE family)
MRVLFTILPGTGHLHPVVRLCRALSEVGHEAAVACSASFAGEVETSGLEAFAAGRDWTEAEADRTFPGFTDMESLDQVRLFAALPEQGMVEDLVDIGKRWSPDLIVRETFEWGGWVAAELLGLPHAVLSSGVGLPREVAGAMAGDLLGQLPARFGLAPDPLLERSEQYLYLVASPQSFDPLGMSRGPTHARIRPLILEADGPDPAHRRERPLVHATLGTVFDRKPQVLQLIADAFEGLEADLILGTGARGEPEALRLAPNVRAERFVSHAALVPQCDALIFHGGFGTAMTAAAAGVPACLLPLSADQPLNCAVYAATGAAINLAPPSPDGGWSAIDVERLRPDQIAAAVRELLEDPGIKAAARRLAGEIAALPSATVAIGLLEQLAASREPV